MQLEKRTFLSLIIICIALLGFMAPAYAEQSNSVKDCIDHPEACGQDQMPPKKDVQQNETPKVGVTVWDFMKMIFATIFVVALLYLLLKFINKRNKVYQRTQLVENLGGTALGTNRSIQLIKVGKRILIVGVGENIQLLKEIEEQDEYQQLIQDYNEKIDQHIQPSDLVSRILQRRKGITQEEKKETSFHHLLKQQLDDMTKGRKQLYKEMEKKGSDEQ